jgi:cellulose synthase/poly-beta-1,6-N-acetylglucosamine synthase-like glycosyltransferase
MSDNLEKKIDRNELPWYYKLVLKIPGADFLEKTGGIFWGVIVPAFLILGFFLGFFLLISYPFPTNILLAFTIPISVFAIFIKITLNRFINSWNAIFGDADFVWNVDETLQEYVDLLRKQEEKRNPNKN